MALVLLDGIMWFFPLCPQPLGFSMVLSRLSTIILIVFSFISFGFVYLLNADDMAKQGNIFHRFSAQIVQATADSGPAIPDVISQSESERPLPLRQNVFIHEEEKDGVIRRTVSVGRGETLTARLMMAGITRTEIAAALEGLRQHINLRKIKGGQNVVVLYKREGGTERFAGLELRSDPDELVTVARLDSNVFKASTRQIEAEKRRIAMRGVVDDSLYESGLKLGIPATILNTIIKTYSYNIDFQRDVKQGDHFEVLYEQAGSADSATLIYAALEVDGRIMPIYRVALPSGGFAYYDAKGEAIRKGLLRTPVEGAHLTSGFGMRHHPIMGYNRMHKGVDFGAPYGAPIYAAGAGTIEEIGMQRGYGRYIRIRHDAKYSTAYAHMSRFARLVKGSRVAQGDIIGYVGSSGDSTGPHLHYEVLVNSDQVNPMTVNLVADAGLSGKQLAAFQDWRGQVHGQFEQLMAQAGHSDAAKLAFKTKP